MIIPKKVASIEIKKFFRKKIFKNLFYQSTMKNKDPLDLKSKKLYKPDLEDLYFLHQLIIKNKRTTVLEFGSGWSSLVMAHALSKLKLKYSLKQQRRQNPFELFIIENEKKFLELTKKRISQNKTKFQIKNKINYLFSEARMTNYAGNICTEYKQLPHCNPDFIYLDGPDQYSVKGSKNNISTAHKDFMPMVCDILKIENFLQPGTIISCDGRKANARFLKNNFKRKWDYYELSYIDQTIFHLNEKPLGPINSKLIKFYKSK